MQHPAYELKMPARRDTGTIFASPHSGRDYPRVFLRRSVLNEHAIRSSEDAFVDQLVAINHRNSACYSAVHYIFFQSATGLTVSGRTFSHNQRIIRCP